MSDALTDAARQTERALEQYRQGFTMADETDPDKKAKKLIERREQLIGQMLMIADQINLMNGEIQELCKE